MAEIPAQRSRRLIGQELAGLRTVLRHAAHDVRRQLGRVGRAGAAGARIDAYLADTAEPRLQLGAGHHLLPGWLNTDRDPSSDAVHLDATRPLPFADGTFDAVFSEHLVEHLPHRDGLALLREAHRVLRPGGRLRTATPDLDVIVGLLGGPTDPTAARYAAWLADSYFPGRHGSAAVHAVNQVFHGWGHTFLYDEDTLRATLEGVGFTRVARHRYGESDTPALSGLEGHGTDGDDVTMARFETMVLEAVRP